MSNQMLMLPIAALLAISIPLPAVAQPGPARPTAAVPAPNMDAASRKRVIDSAIAKMSATYVFADKVPVIAKALRAGLAGKYRAIADPQAFVDAVNATSNG